MEFKNIHRFQSPEGISSRDKIALHYINMVLTTNGADEKTVWYAMRATYQRGMEAKAQLDKSLVENFIPMHYEMRVHNGRRRRELVPVIRNLIFVHTTPLLMKSLKQNMLFLQYLTEWKDGKRVPIVVPESQMQQFIAVSGTYDEQLIYLEPTELNLTKGTRVRICGGVFEGQEGTYLKLKGHRDKRVVVAIRGVIAVALATVHPSMIEVIK